MSDNSEAVSKSAPVPRWKRLLQNLALSVFVFGLCFIGLEIVLRVAGYGNLEIYAPDEQLYWRLKPDQDCYTKVGRKPVHINSHGTRGAEFVEAKPVNTIRILSLGDSRTFGWGLTEDETYSARLGKLLQEKLGPGRHVEVINAGVNAWSYPQMLVYFRERGLKFQPDVVVLGEANLWTQFSEHNSPEFARAFMRRVWLKNFLRHFAMYHYFVEIKLEHFYQQHRAKFIPVDPKQDQLFKEQQQADPDAVFRDAMLSICQLAKTNGVQPVLLSMPIAGDWTLTNTPVPVRCKREVSKRLEVPLVDVTPDIQPEGNGLYLEADPVHFDARGNEIIGRRLFETVSPLIKP